MRLIGWCRCCGTAEPKASDTAEDDGSDLSLEGARAVGEEHKSSRRGKRESDPGPAATEITGPHEPKRKADLAACRPRQELAQRHEIGVSLLVEPTAANDE